MAWVRDPLGHARLKRAKLGWFLGLVATGPPDQEVGCGDAALAQPLAVVRIDRADRCRDLLGHLEDRGCELGSGVAVLVTVEERRPAPEEIAEALQLHSQRSARGGSAARSPASLELDVQPDLDACVEQR